MTVIQLIEIWQLAAGHHLHRIFPEEVSEKVRIRPQKLSLLSMANECLTPAGLLRVISEVMPRLRRCSFSAV